MSTLLTALFYLWLVLTILLIIMWFIRGRGHGPDDPTETPEDSDAESASSEPSEAETSDTESKDTDLRDTESSDAEAGEPEEPEDETLDNGHGLVTQAQPTIEDLLDGVSLPFDLTPIPGRIEDPDRHAVFLSPHEDAEEVGTAFADELVRIGFAIEPAGFDEALAKRNDEMLSLRISPKAAEVRTGGVPRYPSANPSDIAIEVWTGQGPPPSLAD